MNASFTKSLLASLLLLTLSCPSKADNFSDDRGDAKIIKTERTNAPGITGPSSVCRYTVINYSFPVTSGVTYKWSYSSTMDVQIAPTTGNDITVYFGAGAADGTLTVQNAADNSIVGTLAISILSAVSEPSISFADNNSVTAGGPGVTKTLIAGGCTGTVLWYDQNGNQVSSGSSYTTSVIPIVRSNSEIKYKAVCQVGGCSSLAATTTIFVKATPYAPNVSVVTQKEDCATPSKPFSSPLLTANVCTDATYWYDSPTGGNVLHAGPTYTQKVYSPGTFVYAACALNGVESDTRTAKELPYAAQPTVPTIFTAGMSADAKKHLCDGETTLLQSSVTNSDYDYLWRNDDIVFNTDGPSVTVSKAGGYTLGIKRKDNQCFTVYSPTTIRISVSQPIAKPIITASPSATICVGDSVTLTSSPGIKYIWSDGSSNQKITGIKTSGTYTVKLADADGCFSPLSDPINVKVNAVPDKPVITADGKLSFCDGGVVNLTSTAGDQYIWSNGEKTQTVKITKDGSYSVTVKNANGCSSATSAVIKVTVFQLPSVPTITANGPTTFCADKNVILTSSSLANNAPTKYKWSTGDTTATLTVKVSARVSVRLTDPLNCTSGASDTITIKVLPLPDAPVITAEGSLIFCAKDNSDYKKDNFVKLVATSPYEVTWNTADVGKVLDNVKTAGDYFATAKESTSGLGCISPKSNILTVIIKANPVITTTSKIESDGAFALKATGFPDGGDYEWRFGTEILPFTAANIKTNRYGEYSARRKAVFTVPAPVNQLVCFSDFVKKQFVEDPDSKGLTIYPNPSNGQITIESLQDFKNVDLTVYDLFGRIVYTGQINLIDGKFLVDLRGLAVGNYLFRFKADGFDLTRRIILNR